MNIIDYIFIAILCITAIRCWFRGIVAELLSMAAMVLGLLAAIFFFKPLGIAISKFFPLGKLEPVIGFVAAFLIVFIIIKIIEKTIRDILSNLELNIFDSVLGFIFGLIEGLIIITLVLILIKYQPVFNTKELLSKSFFAHYILPIVENAFISKPI